MSRSDVAVRRGIEPVPRDDGARSRAAASTFRRIEATSRADEATSRANETTPGGDTPMLRRPRSDAGRGRQQLQRSWKRTPRRKILGERASITWSEFGRPRISAPSDARVFPLVPFAQML